MRKKRLLMLLMAAILCLSLAACGGGDGNGDDGNGGGAPDGGTPDVGDVTTYSNSGDTYSIEVPGTWTDNTATSSNSDAIILDNAEQTLSILVQRYPRETMDASLTTKDLNGFMELYKASAIQALVDSADEPKVEDVTIEGMTAAVAEEYTAVQGGTTAKAYIVMIESPNAYYSYTITGLEDLYDDNIDTLKGTVQSLKENAAE